MYKIRPVNEHTGVLPKDQPGVSNGKLKIGNGEDLFEDLPSMGGVGLNGATQLVQLQAESPLPAVDDEGSFYGTLTAPENLVLPDSLFSGYGDDPEDSYWDNFWAPIMAGWYAFQFVINSTLPAVSDDWWEFNIEAYQAQDYDAVGPTYQLDTTYGNRNRVVFQALPLAEGSRVKFEFNRGGSGGEAFTFVGIQCRVWRLATF